MPRLAMPSPEGVLDVAETVDAVSTDDAMEGMELLVRLPDGSLGLIRVADGSLGLIRVADGSRVKGEGDGIGSLPVSE